LDQCKKMTKPTKFPKQTTKPDSTKLYCIADFSVSKQLTPSSQETTNARAGPYDAGDELLEYWQVQWEAIHMAQDQVQIH
jgi:hypothetical protein